MKAGWEEKTLGEVCEMYQPKTISVKDMIADGAYPVFGANGVIGRYDKFNHEEPQLLITCRGATSGSVNISEPKSWITGNAMVVKPKASNIEIKFLEYYFRGGVDIQKAITGAAQPQITRANLEPLNVSFPSTQEQQRIVAILDQAFEGIAKARANAEQNLQYARALFESHLQSVFTVRGEPVESHHPSTSSGRTGDGWEIKTFDDVLEIKNGKDQKSVEKAGGKYPIYGSAGNVMGWTDSYICDEQTTIIGRKGTINRPIFIETKFWNVDTAFGLAAKPNLNAKFLYFFCLSYDFSLHNRGTTIPSLVKTDLLNIKISLPSLGAQEKLVEKFSALHKETQRLEALYQRKIACLDELKKSLLQQAFAGEL